MIIGVDASRANRPKKTGVEWYSYQIIQYLKRLPEAGRHSWLLYGNTPLTHGLEQGPAAWHEVSLHWWPKYLWTQLRLSWEMWRRPPEVLYVAAHVLPRIIPRRTVVVIHDVGFHRLPHLYKPIQRWYHEWSTRDILKRASKIITVSEFSKAELVDAYQANPAHIEVIHLGMDHDRYVRQEEFVALQILERFQLTTPFFLCIGRIEYKKNISVVIRAFEAFMAGEHHGDEDFQLVLAGQPGVGYQEIEALVAESPVRERIRLLGYITEEEKIALLSTAAALIHPSWYEGFGIPIVEAMACLCPVICSRLEALLEIGGESHARWFDPNSARELAEQMEDLARADVEPEEVRLREAAIWSRQYTWERAAERTLEALTTWN